MANFDGLGQALAALRTERGLNQRELAERAQVARGLMSQYESGQVSPTLPTLDRLLDAMAVTPRELIDKLETVQRLTSEGRKVEIPRMTENRKRIGAGPPGAYLMIPVALEPFLSEAVHRELLNLPLNRERPPMPAADETEEKPASEAGVEPQRERPGE